MTKEPPTPIPGKTFDEWLADIMPQVSEAQNMLEESLSRDFSELSAQATMTEDSYRKMSDLLTQAERWLEWSEYVELMRLPAGKTVFEKDLEIKVKVMAEKMLRDKIKGIAASLKSRMRRSQWQQ